MGDQVVTNESAHVLLHDVGVRGRFVAVATALLVAASGAHDLMGEQDPTHVRVLVLALVNDGLPTMGELKPSPLPHNPNLPHLFGDRVNHADEEVLFLLHSALVLQAQSVVHPVVGLDAVDLHLVLDEADEVGRVDVDRLALAVVQHDDEVEEVALAQVRRRLLLEMRAAEPSYRASCAPRRARLLQQRVVVEEMLMVWMVMMVRQLLMMMVSSRGHRHELLVLVVVLRDRHHLVV